MPLGRSRPARLDIVSKSDFDMRPMTDRRSDAIFTVLQEADRCMLTDTDLNLRTGDAWIYTQHAEAAEELSRMLAELGFSPRRVAINGSLRPASDDGSAPPRPDLAMVLDDRGDATPVCTRLREDDELGEVPIVVSVGPDDLELNPDVLKVHELIVAPFTTAELSARIARARSAVQGVENHELVRSGTLELNVATHRVKIDGKPVAFTYTEYELLKFMMTHPQRAFSRETLLSRVWSYDFYGSGRTVDVHVRRVRAKVGSEHATKLQTVRRVGYRWES
jgi:DNA-binding response OmpR family regulator